MAAHKAFVTVLQALEMDGHTLPVETDEECDRLFQSLQPIVNKPYDYETKMTLLHLAAAHNNFPLIERLIRAGANVNTTDAERKTPLFHLPAAGGTQARELLLSHGAIDDEEYFFRTEPEFKGGVGFLNRNVMRKLVLVLSAPVGILLFVNGLWFAVKFLLGTIAFYFVVAGYFVSELSVRPVWYNYDPKAKHLTFRNLPEEWRGCCHDPKFHFGYEYEDVTFESAQGGFRLSAWLVHGRSGTDMPRRELALVFTHGGGRDRRSWLRFLPIFVEQGYTCLLYDMREHGPSSGTGKGFTYGIMERWDVVGACRYMKRVQGFARVAAIGTSVGAAATIMAAAAAKADVDCVVAENPMLTAAQLQNVLIQRVVGPLLRGTFVSRPLFALFRKIASVWLNARLGNIPSQRCQSHHVIQQIAPRPLLLMHGTFDEIVPASHGQLLFDLAQEPKEFWLLPEASHCGLYDHSPEEWKRRVLTFLAKAGSGEFARLPRTASLTRLSGRAASPTAVAPAASGERATAPLHAPAASKRRGRAHDRR